MLFYLFFFFFFFIDEIRLFFFFFFQAEDGIRDPLVTGVQTCALPISGRAQRHRGARQRGGRRRPVLRHGGGVRDGGAVRAALLERGVRGRILVTSVPVGEWGHP